MTYSIDPVVEDIRKVHEKIMKEFDYNPHSLGRVLAEREKLLKRKPVKTSRKLTLANNRA